RRSSGRTSRGRGERRPSWSRRRSAASPTVLLVALDDHHRARRLRIAPGTSSSSQVESTDLLTAVSETAPMVIASNWLGRNASSGSAIFLDSTGRSYGLPVNGLPSARSHGTPLTGFFKNPSQSRFISVLMGAPKQKLLIASNAGYGFVTQIQHMHTRNQKGKALLSLPGDAQPLPPLHVTGSAADFYVVAITAAGRMLMFPLPEMPELQKGKGNKIIHIKTGDITAGKDFLKHLALLPDKGALTLFAGRRHFRLVFGNIANFMGSRGQRGKKLPRGFQNVDSVTVEKPKPVVQEADAGENEPESAS
ncbi:MAG: hypothetical protein R6T92_08480, partial [Desulfosalsimonadaceae bacterium]